MIQGLKPISINELKKLSIRKFWKVDGFLDKLPSLSPIKGEVSAEHQGNLLNVKGNISTIVNLYCDRCLQSYNQTLSYNSEEMIWIGKEIPFESEFQPDISSYELMESLDLLDNFDPEHWIIDHLNLQLPIIKRCANTDCNVPSKNFSDEKVFF